MQTTDPVCGMQIDSERAVGQTEWKGTTYYFCSAGCQNAFERYPSRFAAPPDSGETRATGEGVAAERRGR